LAEPPYLEGIFEEERLEEGLNFIQKPFSVKNLAAKVREVLDATNESPVF
jgi:hypothetical protein